MRFEARQEVGIGGLNTLIGFGIHAEYNGGFAHAAAGEIKRCLPLGFIKTIGEDVTESILDKIKIGFVKIPTVMHCRAQQPLAAKKLKQMRNGPEQWCLGINRFLAEAFVFEIVENVCAVLNKLALWCFDHRNNPTANVFRDDVLKTFATGFYLHERDIVLSHIGAHFRRVERPGHAIKCVILRHCELSSTRTSQPVPAIISSTRARSD